MAKRILYLECKTGAAGDMLMGALYGLLSEENRKLFLDKMNSLWEGVTISAEEAVQKGIGGIRMHVKVHGHEEEHEPHHQHSHHHEHGPHHEHEHESHHGHESHHEHGHHHHHEHHHTSYPEILERIAALPMSQWVRENAAEIYRRIGEAESKVHQTTMEQIHFHEVGSLDALADVAGSCLAIELLGVDEILASPVCVGNGTVRCAHGVLPVPAPATAEIIKGIPVYFSETEGEMLTPTGAAVLKHFVKEYTSKLSLEIENIGYGMGTREFESPSFVRAFLGQEL